MDFNELMYGRCSLTLKHQAERATRRAMRTPKRPILARRTLFFQHDGFSLVLT